MRNEYCGFVCAIAGSAAGNFDDNSQSTALLSISFAPAHTSLSSWMAVSTAFERKLTRSEQRFWKRWDIWFVVIGTTK